MYSVFPGFANRHRDYHNRKGWLEFRMPKRIQQPFSEVITGMHKKIADLGVKHKINYILRIYQNNTCTETKYECKTQK